MAVAVPNGIVLLLLGWLFIIVALRANDVDTIPDVLFKRQQVCTMCMCVAGKAVIKHIHTCAVPHLPLHLPVRILGDDCSLVHPLVYASHLRRHGVHRAIPAGDVSVDGRAHKARLQGALCMGPGVCHSMLGDGWGLKLDVCALQVFLVGGGNVLGAAIKSSVCHVQATMQCSALTHVYDAVTAANDLGSHLANTSGG